MSQTEFARQIKVGESQLSRYVNGLRPPRPTQERIAKKLGIDRGELWPTT